MTPHCAQHMRVGWLHDASEASRQQTYSLGRLK